MDSIRGLQSTQSARPASTPREARPATTGPATLPPMGDRVTLGETEGLERPLKRSDFQRAVFTKTAGGAGSQSDMQCRPGDGGDEKIRSLEQLAGNAMNNGDIELANKYHREAEELKRKSGKEKTIETPSAANPPEKAPAGGKSGETPKAGQQPPVETPPPAPTTPPDPAPTTPQDQAPPQPPTPTPNPPQPPARDPGMLGEDGRDTGRGYSTTPGLGSFLDWLRNLGGR